MGEVGTPPYGQDGWDIPIWFVDWATGVERLSSMGINKPISAVPGVCFNIPQHDAPACGPQSGLGFGSYHAGGANFLLCDGSVHFVKDSTDTRVLSALGTRAGGEVTSGSDF
jgi:prepilin-type processing-associated H-X9-DG protein